MKRKLLTLTVRRAVIATTPVVIAFAGAVTAAMASLKASAPVSATSLRLKVEGRGRYYDFLYADGTDSQWKMLARGVDAANLSTNQSGGFIGACIGLYATNNKTQQR